MAMLLYECIARKLKRKPNVEWDIELRYAIYMHYVFFRCLVEVEGVARERGKKMYGTWRADTWG